MRIWRGVKRAVTAIVEGEVTSEYLAAGKKIVCEHCGETRFRERTALATGDAYNVLTTLMCETCGRIFWYGVRPDRVRDSSSGMKDGDSTNDARQDA